MELPEPLTPADADLKGFDRMWLNTTRLFRSELWARSTGDEFKAALKLWAEAMLESPAGSLPDDDYLLARLADYGRDVDGWLSVKAMALHGWIKCSDGRLYHHFVAETVTEAWAERLKFKEKQQKEKDRKQAYRDSLQGRQSDSDGYLHDVPRDIHGTDSGQDAEIRAKNRNKNVNENVNGIDINTPYSPPELELEAEEEKTASPDGFACVGESFESVVQESFENLWDEMPLRKVSKETAIKAWKKICTDKRTGERKKKTPDDEIMQAIRSGADAILKIMLVQAEHVAGYESPFHRLHLGTYLNGKRWRDEEMPERLRPMKAGGAA